MKKKKKSLVGWTYKNWIMTLPNGRMLDFNYVRHSCIYRTSFKDSLNEKYKTKVRITIEEL